MDHQEFSHEERQALQARRALFRQDEQAFRDAKNNAESDRKAAVADFWRWGRKWAITRASTVQLRNLAQTAPPGGGLRMGLLLGCASGDQQPDKIQRAFLRTIEVREGFWDEFSHVLAPGYEPSEDEVLAFADGAIEGRKALLADS